MDSKVQRDGRQMDIVDLAWAKDKLPDEDVAVPQMELPELEPDNGHTNETLKEQEQKWVDLALGSLQEQTGGGGSGSASWDMGVDSGVIYWQGIWLACIGSVQTDPWWWVGTAKKGGKGCFGIGFLE